MRLPVFRFEWRRKGNVEHDASGEERAGIFRGAVGRERGGDRRPETETSLSADETEYSRTQRHALLVAS